MYNINNPAYTLVYISGRFNFEERLDYKEGEVGNADLSNLECITQMLG